MTTHPDNTSDRQAVAGSAEHWLLAALDPELREGTRQQWQAGRSAVMPTGRLFSAVGLPHALVLAHAGEQQEFSAIDEVMSKVFEGGPVICDPCRPARWYALVPPNAALWLRQSEAWRAAGIVGLGAGSYISVPPPDATAHDPRTLEPYWAVPVSLPGDLCDPGHVDRLITTTPDQLDQEDTVMTGADVLLTSDEPWDPDEARLMIQEVPAAERLTRQQNRGESCVWCGQAADEGMDLTRLGGGLGWWPHGCAACGQLRITYVRAYLAWRRHVLDCQSCRTEWCPDGWSPALTHQIAHAATGKAARVLCACGCPLALTSRRLLPYVETNILFHLRYSHTGPCHGRDMAAPVDEGTER
ncbi:hypothetical protein [Streptomyces sp. NPDC087856]|uniref:hypothetical protein n=1 Tax=Streptomyces sp. NPDC087856 TaxID=3365811 RepID=UPI003822A139